MNSITDNRPVFSAISEKNPEDLFGSLPCPCYVIDETVLIRNCRILSSVMKNTGCKILLAQKAFSNFSFYPLLSEYLSGTEASGLYEARLGKEKMPSGEVHVFCGAYREKEFDELLIYADHIVFNSPAQLKKFGRKAKEKGKGVGLRVNPECSTQNSHEIYDPCAAGSRLGTTRGQWNKNMTSELLDLLDGIHFHTLCEQDSDALKITLAAIEEKFGGILPKMKWLNMGGGHHITKPGYNIDTLEKCINYAQKKWDLQVYIEPGEAVALNAGYLVTRVLDIVENNGIKTAVIDASAACHMPDVIEMPYTPPLYGADHENLSKEIYRIGGPTCLSGDIVGDYSFNSPLRENDLLVFGDMAIYTTCKNNTFNGMPLPDIWKLASDGKLTKLTNFTYKDFECRLG